MKQFLLFACLSIFTLGLNAQVYVDADATGTGDGTSWANAFTDLDAALQSTVEGDAVWVADGRYVTPADTSFVINKGISLLGGFNGTETDADDADPATNVTTLSGDVMGDDVAGTNDSLTRVDNQRVLFVSDSSSAGSLFTATISGFTIRDGNKDGFPAEGGFVGPFAGAGIFATGQVNITDVIFEDNQADFGSAVCILNLNADNSVLDNITATSNYNKQGAAVYNRNTDGVVVRNSTFGAASGDATLSGMILAIDVIDFTIEDSDFANIVTDARGGAIHVEGTAGTTTVRNVTVDNSEADLGGAIYLRNFDVYVDDDGNNFTGNTVMENVTMTNIASQRWGGAVLLSQVNSVASNITITDVDGLQAGGLGGGLYLQSNADAGVVPLVISWSDIDITNVETNSTGGGIFVFVDPDYEVSITNTAITNTSAVGSGGGLYLNGNGRALADQNVAQLDNVSITSAVANATPAGGGGFGGGSIFFAQDVNITNSTFTTNEGALDGGNGAGVYAQAGVLDDGTQLGISVTVSNSTFTGNRSLAGSGIAVFGQLQETTVTGCTFTENGTATLGGNAHRGGAMAFFHGNGSNVTIDDCLMAENSVVTQTGIVSGGGAIYMNDISDDGSNPGMLTVSNSRMESNIAGETADGGAVYFIDGVDATIENTDMVFNSADDGGAIATFLFQIPDTIDNVPMVSLPPFTVKVKDAVFNANNAGNQGGAVSTSSTAMDFTNCLFYFNTVGDSGGNADGGGGAIIFNGSGPNVNANNEFESAPTNELTSEIVNCTFYSNLHRDMSEGARGDVLAIFQPQNPFNDEVVSTTVTLQNNAFIQNSEDEAPIEYEPTTTDAEPVFGTIVINSLGGNFFNAVNGDEVTISGEAIVTDTDIDLEVLFEDPGEDPEDLATAFRPLISDDNNPLIDAGTTGDLVPDAGLLGNPRGETPDIGAYELDWAATGVETIANSGLDVDFFPNPTVDVVNVRSNDARVQDYTMVLTDNNGRILRTQQSNGTVNRVDLTNVPTGVYYLQLIVDGNVYSQQVVKQ